MRTIDSSDRKLHASRGTCFADSSRMSWLTVLWIVAFLAAVAAVTGIKAPGTRPVAHTGLMSVARVVLGLMALVVAYFAYTLR